MKILAAAVWPGLLLLSFIGWGSIPGLVLYRGRHTHWSLQAGWGIASSLILGGLLNLFALVSVSVVFAHVFAGLTLFVLQKWRDAGLWPAAASQAWGYLRSHPVALVLSIATFVWTVADLLSWTWYDRPNIQDDMHAYLVFPERMLQTGAMGPDPFNARMHMSALGGMSFLHAQMLTQLSFRYLNLMDAGIGLIVTLGLVWHYGMQIGAKVPWILLAMLAIMAIPNAFINATAMRLATALFICTCLTVELSPSNSRLAFLREVLIAMLIAGIVSLKSSLVPSAGVLVAAAYILRMRTEGQILKHLAQVAIIGLCILLFLSPWMIAAHRSGGTYFYPILGTGNVGPAYANFTAPAQNAGMLAPVLNVITNGMSLAALLLVLIGGWGFRTYFNQSLAAMTMASAALAGALMLEFATHGAVHTGRYNFPANLAAIAMLFLCNIRAAENISSTARRMGLAALSIGTVAAVVLVCFFQTFPVNTWKRLEASTPFLKSVGQYDTLDLDRVDIHARVQQSIPPGKTILARLSFPFMMDFTRNPVMVLDIPGGFSPPPGLPLGLGAESLANYLQRNGVDYFVYSYGDSANFGPDIVASMRDHPADPVSHSIGVMTERFNADIAGLAGVRKKIYDDGWFMAIDLSRKPDK